MRIKRKAQAKPRSALPTWFRHSEPTGAEPARPFLRCSPCWSRSTAGTCGARRRPQVAPNGDKRCRDETRPVCNSCCGTVGEPRGDFWSWGQVRQRKQQRPAGSTCGAAAATEGAAPPPKQRCRPRNARSTREVGTNAAADRKLTSSKQRPADKGQ